MVIKVYEDVKRRRTIGQNAGEERRYFITHDGDESNPTTDVEIHEFLLAQIPTNIDPYGNGALYFARGPISIDVISNGLRQASVQYGGPSGRIEAPASPDDPDGYEYDADTTGGTVRVRDSLRVTGIGVAEISDGGGGYEEYIDIEDFYFGPLPLDGTKATYLQKNTGGPINVNRDGEVEGIDIDVADWRWSETHTFNRSQFTPEFRRTLANFLRPRKPVNEFGFRGFDPQSVLLERISVSGVSSADSVKARFDFRHSKNVDDLTIGTGTYIMGPDGAERLIKPLYDIVKKGHEYLDVRYDKFKLPNKQSVLVPVFYRVHQIYPLKDFADLQIGVN